jgi:hypothetical protein
MTIKLIANGAALLAGTSLLSLGMLAPRFQTGPRVPEVSSIQHLTPTQAPNLNGDIPGQLAVQQYRIESATETALSNRSDIQTINANAIALDKRELEHYNDLKKTQELDEAKVLQTLKVLGLIITLAEAFHVYLTLKGQFEKRGIRGRRRRTEADPRAEDDTRG